MASAGDILKDELFGDVVDTPKEATEQHEKRGELESAIDKGKLGYKWAHERVNKASHEIINKKYVEYKQRKLNKKGEDTGKALGRHVINLHSTGISRWVKLENVKKLRQDIENDPIIKDQMAGLGCLFVYTFIDWFIPILIATHTANNLDRGHGPEDEGYKSEGS